MKKIMIFALAALMSLSLLSCDIDQPRPNSGDVNIVVKDIPNTVKAMSIWCTANGWKADNVNGSDEYIAEVKPDGTATFTLKGYVLSEPLQFQFTPMPSKDTQMKDDWWSYAISGSSQYKNSKNNMVCDFMSKGLGAGCTITVDKSSYGADYWETSPYPIYGVSATRWFNESYKGCFTATP